MEASLIWRDSGNYSSICEDVGLRGLKKTLDLGSSFISLLWT